METHLNLKHTVVTSRINIEKFFAHISERIDEREFTAQRGMFMSWFIRESMESGVSPLTAEELVRSLQALIDKSGQR